MHETVAWHKRNEESFTHYFFVEGSFFLRAFPWALLGEQLLFYNGVFIIL
jgi:hypothetical protein